jgi:hypothetical protein
MRTSAEAAVILSTGGSRPIGASDVMPAVRSGQVVVVPRALQLVGFLDQLLEATFDAIARACDPARADECRRAGLERLHEVLDPAGIEAAVHELERRMAITSPALIKALAHGLFGITRSFYVYGSLSRVRFMLPQTIVAADRARFHSRANRLQLGDYAPHRDYWEGVPINAVNLWMALGPVQPENGLLIYPHMWRKDVTHDGITAREGQDFGEPLAFALQPGDIAVFDGRQLHASAFNVTSCTRAVLTGRLCTERPIAPTADMLERTSFWSPLIGGRLERFAGAPAKLSWAYAVERLKRRATSAVAAVERRTGAGPFHAVRKILRYRRADRPFAI